METQIFSQAMQNHCNVMLSCYTDVSRRMLDTLQALSQLHMQLARDIIAEFGEASQRIMHSRDAAAMGTAVGGQLNPANNALRNYQHRLADTLAQSSASLAQAAETHMPQLSRSATMLAEDVIRRTSEETAKAGERQKQAMEQMGENAAAWSRNGHAGNQPGQTQH